MSIPFANTARIEDVERTMDELVLVRQHRASQNSGNKRYTFPVKTVATTCDTPNYPTTGDTFRVVFLDGKWPEIAGLAGVEWVERDQCYQATIKNMKGTWLPVGTVCLATFVMPPAGTSGNGRWLVDEAGQTAPGNGNTTTTPVGDCAGKCVWKWSASQKVWSQTSSTCGETSTTTTSAGSSTTTSAGACVCPTSTTTTQEPIEGGTTTSGSTTTTKPCACLYPTFCGLADNDCTITYCGRNKNVEPVCGQTSTTTTPPGGSSTTTTAAPSCDCVGSTTTTAVPTAECATGCDWAWSPGPLRWEWHKTMAGCAVHCECLPPSSPGESPCATAHTPCYTPASTTTTPGPPQTCSGECSYAWNSEQSVWVFLWTTCAGTAGVGQCLCFRPSEPGTACGTATVPCVKVDPSGSSTTTTGGGGTTTTANPCVQFCATSTTGTTTSGTTSTTPANCLSGKCKYRWDTTGSAWNLLASTCPNGCPCGPPPYAGSGACHVQEVPCGGGSTTTTVPPSTSTSSSTTTTKPCAQKGCVWECMAHADDPGVGTGYYCVQGNEGVGWYLTSKECSQVGEWNVPNCCCGLPPFGFADCYRVADIGKVASVGCVSQMSGSSCNGWERCSTTTTVPIACGGTCFMGCIGGVFVQERPCDSGCPCEAPLDGPQAGDPCSEPSGPGSLGGTCGTTTTAAPPTSTTSTTNPPTCIGSQCTFVWNAGGAMWVKTVNCPVPFPCGCFQPVGGGAFNGEVRQTNCS